MKPTCPLIACRLLAAVLLGATAVGHAQEFTAFGGTAAEHGAAFDTYSWMLDYRFRLVGEHESSVTWINEGHFISNAIPHHRDGIAWQQWYNFEPNSSPFDFSLGFGPDYFFDSQEKLGQSYDVHRFAAIVSADLRWYPWRADNASPGRFFVRLRASEIVPLHDPQHLLVDFGAGWYLGPVRATAPHQLPRLLPSLNWRDVFGQAALSQITLYLGGSRVNTFDRAGSGSIGGEVRWHLVPDVDGTIGYLHEGDAKIVQRSGVTTQLWLMTQEYPSDPQRPRVGFGLGLGTYVNIDSRRKLPSGHHAGVPFLAGLVSPSVHVDLPWHLTLSATWNRIVTDYNKDADVWLGGIGYRFQ